MLNGHDCAAICLLRTLFQATYRVMFLHLKCLLVYICEELETELFQQQASAQVAGILVASDTGKFV